jgi:beta-aspartyl-dipeptidase (metallo-type)
MPAASCAWGDLTASVVGDLYAIPKVLGVKVALGEHRASRYGDDELVELAAQLHWARGLTGKACVFHAHLGLRRAPAAQLAAVIERSELPPERFVATHVNYGPETLAAPDPPGSARGSTSLGAGGRSAARESIKASAAVRRSTRACRSRASASAATPMPRAARRRGPRSRTGRRSTRCPGAIRDLVCEEGLGLPDALRLVTQHPARALGLEARKGSLAPGKDADIVVMDAGLEVRHVFARGRRLLADGQPVTKSLFEDKVFQDPARGGKER